MLMILRNYHNDLISQPQGGVIINLWAWRYTSRDTLTQSRKETRVFLAVTKFLGFLWGKTQKCYAQLYVVRRAELSQGPKLIITGCQTLFCSIVHTRDIFFTGEHGEGFRRGISVLWLMIIP